MWYACMSKGKERIYSAKDFKVPALRGDSVAYLPITILRFWGHPQAEALRWQNLG